MDFKKLAGDYFGFTKEIEELNAKYDSLLQEADAKLIDLNTRISEVLLSDVSNKAKIVDLQKIIDSGGKGLKEQNYLPDVFVESDSVYKFGFWLTTKQGDSYLAPKDAGGHLTLSSFLYHIIDSAGIKPTDDALTTFNKILGAQQVYTTYIYDQNQWGDSHGENWTPAICVLNTKKDDCESLACLAVSAFEYYRIIENKFPEAYAFVGTGLYNQQYGHGFPCLYLKNGKSLDEALFIGESTLHSKIPVKPLKDCKSMYWCNWGNNSFWHDFRLKPEFGWWGSNVSTNKPLGTDFGSDDEKKKELISGFWKTK